MSEKDNLQDLLNDLKADAQKANETPQQPQQQPLQQQQPQQQQPQQQQGSKKADRGNLYVALFLLAAGILIAVAFQVWFMRYLVGGIFIAAGITALVEYSNQVNRKK